MPLRLVAYQPDLAPNLGALIRLAACAGVALDVIEPCGFPFSTKALRKQALDYSERAEINRIDHWESYAPKGRIVLLSTSGAIPIWDFRFHDDDVLLLGRESSGVPAGVRGRADAIVKVPMPGGGRSLNVAVSAAIALYEALRQTRTHE